MSETYYNDIYILLKTMILDPSTIAKILILVLIVITPLLASGLRCRVIPAYWPSRLAILAVVVIATLWDTTVGMLLLLWLLTASVAHVANCCGDEIE